eukprot:262077-Rhodomonas_salina.2
MTSTFPRCGTIPSKNEQQFLLFDVAASRHSHCVMTRLLRGCLATVLIDVGCLWWDVAHRPFSKLPRQDRAPQHGQPSEVSCPHVPSSSSVWTL